MKLTPSGHRTDGVFPAARRFWSLAIMPVLLVGLAAPALAGTTPGGDESISVIGDPSIGAYDTTITRDGSTGDSAVGKSGGEGTSSQGSIGSVLQQPTQNQK